MESTMMAMAAFVMLLFVIFSGIAAALLVASSVAGILGGAVCLLSELAPRARRRVAPQPRSTI